MRGRPPGPSFAFLTQDLLDHPWPAYHSNILDVMMIIGKERAALQVARAKRVAIKSQAVSLAPAETRSLAKRAHHDHADMLAARAAASARLKTFRNPLQPPTAALQASHTSISLPLGPVDLFGNYSVLGPAVIRKINNALVALVQPGGAVSVLSSSSAGPTYMSCASLSHDEGASAVVNLAGQHLELQGCYELHDMNRTIHHDGKVIVSPATLSDDSCILLLPGGTVSHPVNVHPQHHP